jgi:hypothetical protein
MSVSWSDLTFSEEEGSSGRRGKILGLVYLAEDAFLQVSENVVLVGSHVRRIDYAYFLIIDGVEHFGFERDPSHDPPVHAHGVGHSRLASGPVSFKAVVKLAWRDLSLRDAT